jgi:dihydroorotate dehydrogenase electron transfer subunit
VIRTRAEVLSERTLGAYHSITLVAPDVAERARPGQFVEAGMPEGRQFFLRRPFFIHQASRRGGFAGTIELIVDTVGQGTAWLGEVRAHQFIDLIGPLGNGFGIARPPACLLVAEEYGAAPLYFLAEELRSAGKRVDMIVGAANQERLFKPIEGKRLAHSISMVTANGSVGERGDVMDVIPEMLERCSSDVIYAAGPRPTLRRVAEFCRTRRIPAQVVVEELMACGLGMCLTCAVPIMRKDGTGYEHLRACVEGPVFPAGRIHWDRWGTEPPTQAEESTPVAEVLPTRPEPLPAVRPWAG